MKLVLNGLLTRIIDASDPISYDTRNDVQLITFNVITNVVDQMEKEFPTLEELNNLVTLLQGVNDEYPYYDKEYATVKYLISYFKKWLMSQYE